MNKKQFIQQFVANFLVASLPILEEYADLPVRDAEYMAETAWGKCCENLGWEEEELLQGSAYIEFRKKVRLALEIDDAGVRDGEILDSIRYLIKLVEDRDQK